MKKTKIIATIGPSSDSPQVFAKLVDAGVNIVRLNFSHGGYEVQQNRINMIKRYRDETKKPIGILLDTKGPEIRTKTFKGGEATLVQGAQFILTTRDVDGTNQMCSITYDGLPNDVKAGDKILLNDGVILLEVVCVDDTEIVCTVIIGGVARDRKLVSVPNILTTLPVITERDIQDIEFGIKEGVDFISISFVRSAQSIKVVKQILQDKGAEHIKVIAKIQCSNAIEKLDEIIDAADGVIVARGTLGVEVPIAKMPRLQREIVSRCNRSGKPVIVSTHIIESMINNPLPTRAEAIDISNSINDGADAVMLSGETATGKYPVEAVKMTSSIAIETEETRDYQALLEAHRKHKGNKPADIVAYGACRAADDLAVSAIICPTNTGFTAGVVSKFTPQAPIYALVYDDRVQRTANLFSGVEPIMFEQRNEIMPLIKDSIETLKELGKIKVGDTVLMTFGIPYSNRQTTNTMKIHIVE
ncbi:MAG: pyruvate kinase [Epulopiscium sp. Nuni2H_MBin001]|nr:MAG: pyruvate kinase [Epulopiscium sp. Nuni2H_MBin001]